MKYRLPCVSIVFAAIAACTASQPMSGSLIKVTVGAMDHFSTAREHTISRQETPLLFKANGQCLHAGILQDCMWWGIRFEYPQLERDVMLDCTTIKITDAEAGKPQGLITPTQVSYQWHAKLPSGSTARTLAFFNMPGKGEERLSTHCVVPGLEPVDFGMAIKWTE